MLRSELHSPPPVPMIEIERAAVRAWPAHETRPIGGWLWRFSNGGSRRANSVATLAPADLDADQAIAEAEQLYAARGAPAQFQITGICQPAGLDARLAAAGYALADPCTTLWRALDPGGPLPPGAELSDRPTPDWFETYISVITPDRRAQAAKILERIPAPRAFCGVRRDRRLIATALVVVDGRVAIVENVAALAEARRTGGASAVMHAAMVWAAEHGAVVMALGALAANAPAQGLYARLGFRLAGRYHLRIKPLGGH